MCLQFVRTYELQRDSFRSSELDICPATPSHGPLELDLEATFRRSSRLVAYVQHLGLHQSPGWIISVTLPVEEKISNAMSVHAALWSFLGEGSHRAVQVIRKRRIETHGW